MNRFNSSLRYLGFPIHNSIKQLAKLQNYSFEDYTIWREKERWTIFKFHYKNNLFYHNWVNSFSDQKLDNWENIPILTKEVLQRPIHEVLSSGYNKKNVYINNTSGSSGQPFHFAQDKLCHAYTWAINLNRYGRHKITYGKSLQARFYGIPLKSTKYLKEKLKDLLSARVRFPVFDMSDENLERYLESFSKYKFEYINGYTSSLVLFAKFLNSKDIILNKICPSLKVTIPTSEVLNNMDRELLNKSFGVPVVNEYGASELGIIAFEDENYDWIISDENLWIEIIDENGNLLPPGIEGRIIITSLSNNAMPFIRYEIGDIGSINNYRKGNNQVLKSLQGRTNDIVNLPSGKKSPGLTFYYISKSLLEDGGSMKEFVIKQLYPNLFHFEYVADSELTEHQKFRISEAMELYLEAGLNATFERKEKIERTRDGKLKQFQSLIKL